MLKKENVAIKEEIKKCFRGKDLSKNVTRLVEKVSFLEEQEEQQEKFVVQLKAQVSIGKGHFYKCFYV